VKANERSLGVPAVRIEIEFQSAPTPRPLYPGPSRNTGSGPAHLGISGCSLRTLIF